jgi:Domain of unknown function (DUF5069)
MKTDLEKVKLLAKDLRKGYPRSSREKLGGYVIAARCADKCRAFLLGMNGEYNYWPCSLASQWFDHARSGQGRGGNGRDRRGTRPMDRRALQDRGPRRSAEMEQSHERHETR